MEQEYMPYHITAATEQQHQPIVRMKALLGTVLVNSGGDYILRVYDGKGSQGASHGDDTLIAVIYHPKTGDVFPFNCALDKGLAYELVQVGSGDSTPISVTVTYGVGHS